MSLSPESFFPCPHCGEKISKSAKICRFCKHGVSWNLYIFGLPENSRSEIASKVFEAHPKKFFPTFGAARKALESRGKPFLKNLRMEDAEKFTAIFDQYKVPAEQSLHAKRETPKTKMYVSIFLSLVLITLISGYFLKNKKPLEENKIPTTLSLGATTENSPTKSGMTQEVPPGKIRANIESLLISTATVLLPDSSGSAFFVSDGYLISNAHVTKKAKEVEILTYDSKKHKGKVIKSDPVYDISLIKIESKDYPPLKIGDATKLHAGDTVFTIGAPHGLSFSVTKGIVSYVGRNVGGKSFVQADVAINPGNSGGPMIDDDGEIIGINNFIIRETQGLNFAIPSNYLYMGTSPILEGIVSTEADNSIMATWRSWEKTSTSNTTSFASEDEPAIENVSPTTDINNLSDQLKTLQTNLDQKLNKITLNSVSLQKKVDALTAKTKDQPTISEEESIQREIKKYQIQILDLDIQKVQEYLSYNQAAVVILQKARMANLSNPAATQHYDAEVEKLKKSTLDNENIKQSKTAQKKALENQL